ncbi:hypothetical protein A2960_00470 [Candidatus Gottesmanbacteria bacterium RIFCSPLOWO2_01_FULL_39_12b]|uniref:DUF2029 domain-containing protein n=1 Tax=Candidatus Gottesmanbacteria bacterium RIFCSPLOWO2_01_FULL_39_12b TaxID=1798388 RepID=A0A1F6APM1_9BACT|nr:MAG: hypothetical protein A2960_00470 [Candidatus Gottesmanbacteria bacterium RIFCSPLOWO2_01_FULL_39_12b]
MDRKEKISLISGIILIGFTLSVIYHFFLSNYLKIGYPFNTFLFDPSDRFMDFAGLYTRSAILNPYYLNKIPSPYPPFAFILFYPLTLIPQKLSFLLFSLIFVFYFVHYNYKNFALPSLRSASWRILAMTVLSYPFLFLVDRGNLEAFVFILLSLFVYFYSQKSYSKSILFLTMASALKIYPLIFLVLFFAHKKFKETILVLLLVLFLNISSLVFFKGGISANLTYFLSNLSAYNTFYAVKDEGLAFSSSLFSLIKVIIFKIHSFPSIINLGNVLNVVMLKIQPSLTSQTLTRALQIYYFAALALVILISAYVIFIEKTFWKKITLLIFSFIIFPPVSADYKLIHLFIPLWLFINHKSSSKKSDLFYAVCFALLLIPKDYLVFFVDKRLPHFFSISILLNPLIMTIVIITLVADGVKKIKIK